MSQVETSTRKSELLATLATLDEQWKNLDLDIRAFRRANTTVVNGAVCFLTSDITSRPKLEQRWRDYCREMDQLRVARNEILSQLADCA